MTKNGRGTSKMMRTQKKRTRPSGRCSSLKNTWTKKLFHLKDLSNTAQTKAKKPIKMSTGGLAASQKSLKAWTGQDWRTKSGKPSTQGSKATGERYLPAKAIKSLSDSEYAASTRAKRKGTAKGKQFVAQPKKIAAKVKPYRKIT